MTGIRWKRFGGRKRSARARSPLDYCRPGENCPDNGKRIRLVASKPGYCTDSGKIEYLRLTGYIGGSGLFGNSIRCSG